jgi:hypothetical protein
MNVNKRTYVCVYMYSCVGTWGDHITLVAIAEIFGVAIRIISSVPGDEFFTEIDPMENKEQRGRAKTVFLSHWWEYHYCSLTENDNSTSLSVPLGVCVRVFVCDSVCCE